MKYLKPFNESISISDIDTINDITLELSDLGLSVKSYYASKTTSHERVFDHLGVWKKCDKHDPKLGHMFITIRGNNDDDNPFEVTDELIDAIDRLDNYVKSLEITRKEAWKPLITFESYNGDFNLGKDSFKPSYLKSLKGLLLIELEFNLTRIDYFTGPWY